MTHFRGLEITHRSVAEAVSRGARERPDAPAVEAADRSLDYAGLDALAERIAGLLLDRGIGSEQRVGVTLGRSAYQVAAILGIWKAGATYVPVDPQLPRARREWVCADAGVGLLIVGPLGEPVVNRERVDLELLELSEIEGAEAGAGKAVEGSPDDLAYVLYTSGSTGSPKRVGTEHGSLVVLAEALAGAYGLGREDRVLQLASTAWDTHLEEIVPTLAVGATLLIPPWSRPASLTDVTDFAGRKGVTVLSLSTALWSQMVRAGIEWPASVRTTIVGGEPLRGTDATAWLAGGRGSGSRLFNTYGLTEACAVSALCEVTAETAADFVPIGAAIEGTRIDLLDAEGGSVAPGEVGEIAIAGAGLSREAHRLPRSLLLTGDSARRDESGAITCVGREDDQVKIGGARVSLIEVEATLREQAGVEAAAVVAFDSELRGTRLAALVEPRSATALDGVGLRRALAEVLIPAAVPGRIDVVDAVPRLPSGKVDRPAVRERLAAAPTSVADADDDPLVDRVAALVAEGIGIARVDPGRHFVDLGGDSLTAMIVVARLGALGHQADVEGLLSAPSIRGFAEELHPASGPSAAGEGASEAADHAITAAQELAYEAATESSQGPQCYLDQDVWRIDGDLDRAALRGAWEYLVRRHASLRSSFQGRPGGVRQTTCEEVELPFEELDWRDLDELSQGAALREACDEGLRRPLDLGRAPLFRVQLIRYDERNWWLVWTVHRLVLDGWSTAIALRDLLGAYAVLASGGTPEQPPALPYGAFAEWIAARPVEEAQRFWADRLAGFDSPTEVPGADLRAKLPGRVPLSIHEGRVEGADYRILLETCRRGRATLSTAIRGAWGRMLLERSGAERVLFGATTSLRAAPLKGIDRMTGFLINWVPVVQGGDEDGEEWLGAFQERQSEAQAHAFADPREVLRWGEVGFEWPLFDTVVTVQNYPGASRPIEVGGLALSSVFAREQVHYPLSLVARPSDTALTLQLTYDARRIDDSLAVEILAQTQAELAAGAARMGSR